MAPPVAAPPVAAPPVVEPGCAVVVPVAAPGCVVVVAIAVVALVVVAPGCAVVVAVVVAPGCVVGAAIAVVLVAAVVAPEKQEDHPDRPREAPHGYPPSQPELSPPESPESWVRPRECPGVDHQHHPHFPQSHSPVEMASSVCDCAAEREKSILDSHERGLGPRQAL